MCRIEHHIVTPLSAVTHSLGKRLPYLQTTVRRQHSTKPRNVTFLQFRTLFGKLNKKLFGGLVYGD